MGLKTKSLLLCLRYNPPIVFRRQNRITFIFTKNDVTWPLSANDLSPLIFFAPLAYAHHYLMRLIKQNLWILKEHNNFCYLWKFEPDVPKMFGEILFEKPQNLQRMYELINVLAPSSSAVFDCWYFLSWLQRGETCKNYSN